ncbi:uncharacterized protein LOC107823594 isoform X1 [Nicotiana tabacum]|uniref:Double-stranded RNA-binding protein 1-like isoform X1 n=1 Tax=Nicotiana tabacum TaxID=4097 RepID=A0A1S4CX90_TOBAC|nr:PREDICTED: double-stranded RNA-binding protein 1-like isoform X1 [Nicotiana tabacum]
MYKSKLQELCQNKKWGLPKYWCMKDGAEHNPQFKASVVVDGINFDSPTFCKSSKEAHNEAAKFAFLHFTFGGSLPTMEDSGVTKIEEACQNLRDHLITSEIEQVSVSLPTIKDSGPAQIERACKSQQDNLNISQIKQEDSHYQCKKKLQMYTKRKKLGEPVYHSKRKSSSRDLHNDLHFEATVTVAGELFKSPGAYKTAEEAEDAVAQHALMTLVTVAFQKSNTGNYKSFLQELAQHEGLCLPEYKTIRIGEPHNLTFFSSVEVEGEVFHGNASKSKKQAEENAAKVAYMALAKCKSFHASDPLTVSSDLEGEIFKTEACLDSLSISHSAATSTVKDVHQPEESKKKTHQLGDSTISSETKDEKLNLSPCESLLSVAKKRGNPTVGCPPNSTSVLMSFEVEDEEKEDEEMVHSKHASAQSIGAEKFNASSFLRGVHELSVNENSPSSMESMVHLPKETISSAAMAPTHSSTANANSSARKTAETKRYLLCNRVRVYKSIPDEVPKGTIVLPIGEDKWVVVNLEIPNEKV